MPHHFNPNLTIEGLDFNKGSCIMIPRAVIDCSIVSKYSKELEYETDSSKGNQRLNVSMKIVKEVYGNEDVTLYFFMFSIYKDQSMQTIKEGAFDKLIAKNSYDFSNDSQEYNRFTDSLNNESMMSFVGNQNSQSASSQSLASMAEAGFEELKCLEDNIDYNKTPKSLLIVKLIFNSIILLIIALTCSLLILD